MQTLNILFACFLALLSEAGYSQQVTNSGPAVCGVELSLAVSNSLIASGSRVIIDASIRNSSSNVVAIGDTGQPIYDFEVSLVDTSGKNHNLRPHTAVRDFFHNRLLRLNPGKTYRSEIAFHLDKNIEPGVYVLEARRGFLVQSNSVLVKCTEGPLVSNMLELHVR